MERRARPRLTDADLAALYPMPVEACIARPGMEDALLTEEEAACVARAGPQRRRDFTLGRAALKAALARLGATGVSAPSRPDRTPVLPAGLVASLSHCEGFCAAVAARAEHVDALGFDAEPARPLADGVVRIVCGPLDQATDGPGDPELRPLVVFSAKEAMYKCQYPLTGAWLDFHDVGIRFPSSDEGDRGRFSAVFRTDAPPALRARGVEGSWRVADGLVLTAAWPDPPTDAGLR